ncbi:MAG: S8 family serine peptidase [Chloroflexota bacterium]
MARIGSGGSARSLSRRRILFLTLLLMTLLAPAGWVAAGEFTSAYVVLFDQAAVSVPDADADFSADAVHSFRDLVAPPALRLIIAAASPSARTGGATRVDSSRVDAHIRAVAGRNHVRVNSVYANAVGGFSARLNHSQLAAISADPSVEAVIPDVAVSIDDSSIGSTASVMRTVSNPSWQVPAGVRRVGARTNAIQTFTQRTDRVDADVAILDTGVERDHPDLNVVGGYNCTGPNRNKWDDNDGHGTHVAGIVGALDNNIGVVGVAPGVRLWSVKVLDANGNGYLSWLVCGIDWVTAQRDPKNHARPLIEVANMSISFSVGPSPDSTCANGADVMHQAICRSVAKGTTYAVAAGNNSRNAQRNRPAAYDEVITVSAMADYDGKGGGKGKPSDSCPTSHFEPDDSFTNFSDYGPDVDLIAPGRCVLSTYMGKRYAFMSGTSMATPHVTGAAAIYRAMYPNAKPAQVKLALQAVGTLDWRTSTDPDSQHERALWVGDFRRPPDFTVSTPAMGVAGSGGTLNLTVQVSRFGGFAGPVNLTLSDAPDGFSAADAVAIGKSAVLQVNVARRTRAGTYDLTIVARGMDVEHQVRIQVVVSKRG